MDFFARQEQARRKTKWLVGYFIVAVIAIIVAVYVIALVLFSGYQSSHHYHHYYDGEPAVALSWWNPSVFFLAVAGVLAVVFGGSAYKTSELAAGGSAVAGLMGGRPVNQDTQDPQERKLLNVVEEMSIASGVPMPQVYVMDGEHGINAFAAGHTPSDAAIGVTRGCIESLTRDELQGVIGHEFSHILNGDMRLNIRLISTIFGLLCLATIGRILVSTRGGSGRDRNLLVPIGLALVALGAIGVFFGRLIQAAISRQREFLADASSVQFTRNPAGLSGALQKIGGSAFGSRLESDHAPDLCHMFFGNGLGEPAFDPMATHPPLPERIRAIDPAWDGRFHRPESELQAEAGRIRIPRPPPPMPNVLGAVLTGAAMADEIPVPPPMPSTANFNGVLDDVGNVTPEHLAYATQLFAQLPDSLKAAVRDPLNATAFIYALLLAEADPLQATQLAEIATRTSPALAETAAALQRDLSPLARTARLPLVNLAIGSMRNLTPEQYSQFSDTLTWVVESDRQIDLFEFVLQRVVQRHLAPHFTQVRPAPVQYYVLKPLQSDCAVILSALASVGTDDPAANNRAFAKGAALLGLPYAEMLPLRQCGLDEICTALDHLVQGSPQIKRAVLAAAAAVVGADGIITQDEAELLRAVADSLDCPVPPALGGE